MLDFFEIFFQNQPARALYIFGTRIIIGVWWVQVCTVCGSSGLCMDISQWIQCETVHSSQFVHPVGGLCKCAQFVDPVNRISWYGTGSDLWTSTVAKKPVLDRSSFFDQKSFQYCGHCIIFWHVTFDFICHEVEHCKLCWWIIVLKKMSEIFFGKPIV